MAEAVTLDLPDDMVQQAREIAHRTGRRMADVLTDWLRQGAVSDASNFLVPNADYPIYTPYGNEALAQGLLEALHAEETLAHTNEPKQ